MDPFDLNNILVTDNHCHGLEKQQSHLDEDAWKSYFTESSDVETRASSAETSTYYHRLLHRLGDFLETEHTEAKVLSARAALGTNELIRTLFADAGIGTMIIDQGYPAADQIIPMKTFGEITNCDYGTLPRLESLFQDLIRESSSLDELMDLVRYDLSDLRSKGHVGLKSIVGYRTGLDICHWNPSDVRQSYTQAMQEVTYNGIVRLGHKPLLDTLLHLAFEAATIQELPVQFHIGYGDRDVDLRKASPLELRSTLENERYRSMPVVLLHGCWPYFREGAYLASVYPNVYFDISFGIPFLSMAEMRSMTSAVLGSAPLSKIMYSSDGVRIPEIFWLAARDGRKLISSVLAEMVGFEELTTKEAQVAGHAILSNSATKLYGVTSRRQS